MRQNTEVATEGTLAACSKEGSMFEGLEYAEWKDEYHKRVQEVIDAHIENLGAVSSTALECSADDYGDLLNPTGALTALAGELPAWQDGDNLTRLSEADLGPVLLEFLRVYKCSMAERKIDLQQTLAREDDRFKNTSENLQEYLKQTKDMDTEMRVASIALDRTLTIVGGFDRLQPLAADLECLKRTSKDIDNVTGLLAEASACMPKILDARGSLRDLTESER